MDEVINTAHEWKKVSNEPVNHRFVLQLYIAGATPCSRRAIKNVQKFCQESLTDMYELQVIDIFQQPFLAKTAQILAVPTLIKKLPTPKRLFIGDMSDENTMLAILDS